MAPNNGSDAQPPSPLRIGTAEQFARVRALLTDGGYSEPALCALTGVARMNEFPVRAARRVLRDINDVQSLLVALFLDGKNLPWDVVRALVPPSAMEALVGLGLLHDTRDDPDRCTASVLLYPTQELFIASDRDADPDAPGEDMPADVVYPAITQNTQRFVDLMSRAPCEDFLDLCAGTGIAALVASAGFARQSWAVDITERATHFAQFNAALNGIANLTPVTGDLYEAVAGRTFDRIVAHPPYAPAADVEYVYRDGGEDGEQVTRRILAGLHEHLRPGGQFYCNCLMSDRVDAPLEQRVRQSLGPRADEFDVIVAEVKTIDPAEFLVGLIRRGPEWAAGIGDRYESFERLGVMQLVLVAILIRRRAQEREVVTARRRLSSVTTAEDLQWLLRWETASAGWDVARVRRLLESRPRTLPRTRLLARSTLQNGQWALEGCTLTTEAPFAVEASCPTWFLTLLMWCDGRMTARDHLQHLKDAGMVSDDASEDEFAGMVRQLVDAGLVEIEEFPLPDATALREPPVSAAVERAD